MKKMGKRVLSMLLTLCLVVGLVPAMSVEVNAICAQSDVSDFIRVANEAKGKSKTELKLTSDWCCKFVCYCINNSLLSDKIGTVGYNQAANPISLACWICREKEAGIVYSFSSAHAERLKDNECRIPQNRVLMKDKNSFTPQPGDIILFSWDLDFSKHIFGHVGIVSNINYEKKTMTYIDGNSKSDGGKYTYVVPHSCATDWKYIFGYIRFDTCDHEYDSSGRCYKCKDAFLPFSSVLCIDTGLYESITSTALYKYPYLASDRATGSIMASGIQVVDNNAYRNGIGEIWYKANYNGIEGYVKADTIKRYASLPSTLKVEQPDNGYTIQQGNPVDITGSISSNYQLSTISATIDGQNYLNPTPISGIKSSGYSLYYSNVNYQLKGATLSVGTHELRITATDVSGASKTATTTIRVNAKQESKVDPPTIKVINEYVGGKTVRVQQTSSGAKLYYTVNGETTTASGNYADINITGDSKVSAYSVKDNTYAYYNGSKSASLEVSVAKLVAPEIQVAPKPDGALITIIGDGEVYYSIDGSMSQRYHQPFSVPQSCTIRAYAQKAGYQTSETESAIFTATEPSTPDIRLLSTNSDIAIGNAITVQWDKLALASSYTVQTHLDGVELPPQVVKKNSATIAAPEAGVYTISVIANNSFGSSAPSKSVKVTAHAPVTVRFVSDDEVLSEQSVSYGGNAVVPATPTKRGYTFTGWSQNLNKITQDTTIEAQYRINMYTLRFYQCDGRELIDSVTVPFGSSVDTTEIEQRVTMKSDFNKFVGWHITESDAESLQSLDFVDSDMVLIASQKWAEESLPIGVNIVSATRNDDATGYDVTLSLYTADEEILNPNRQDKNAAIKAKIIAVIKTANGQMLASEMSTVNLVPGAFDTPKTMFISYNGGDDGSNYIASTIEVSVVGIDGNDRTGGALSRTVSATPTINIYYSDWMEQSDLPASASNVESKTQYRYTDSRRDTTTRSNTSGTAPAVSGYTLVGTSDEWGNWSGWSDTAVSANSNRQVETRRVEATAAYTQYRYGAWVSGSKRHFCPQAAKSYYGGTWTKQYSAWQNSAVSPDTSSTLYCAGSNHTHINPDTYDNKGWPNWYRYRIGGTVYYWEETQTIAATYKTQYRYRDRNYTYTYEKWTTDAPSAWSDTVYSSYSLTNSKRVVETQQLYRYQTTAESESIVGTITEQTVSGVLVGARDNLEGKRATVMVYKQTNSDPTEPQLEFIGQTTLGEGNSYSLTFRPKEEPSVETGDFVVALAIEGCANVVNVKKIFAPDKQYHVTFYGFDDQILAEQDVEKGESITAVDAPVVEGYSFVCWDTDTTCITHDVDVRGIYWPNHYSVVFVDHENGMVNLKTDYTYGEQIIMPDMPTSDSSTFVGWELISNKTGEPIVLLDSKGIPIALPDGTEIAVDEVVGTGSGQLHPDQTVREDLIAVASWRPIQHQVVFMSSDGSVIQNLQVNHGEAAQPPVYNNVPDDMVFLGWSTDAEWWNVTSDMEVYPIVVYSDTALMPTSNASAYSVGTYAEVTLEAEEGATIYYTLDGSDPSMENVESDNAEAGYIRSEDAPITYVYDGTLELTDSAFIRAISVVDGKNESDIIEIEFVYNDENQGQLDYDDAVELGTYNVVAEPGKTITLNFDIHDNPGLLAYAFTVEADPTVFGVVYDEETYEADIVPGTVCTDKGTALLGNYQEGVGWQILWFGTSAAEGDGTLCTIQLQIADDVEEGKVYPVTVRYSPANTISEQDFEEDLTGKVAVSTFGNAGVLGDVNSDGYITTIDVVRIARYLIDDITFTKKQLASADVTGDGHVTASDVIRLARYLVGLTELN